MQTVLQWAQMFHNEVPSIPTKVFYAWILAESGPTVQGNNPLNVMSGGRPVVYSNPGLGLDATIAVLHQGNMSGILHAAQTSKGNPYSIIRAIGESPWDGGGYQNGCTGPGCSIAKIFNSSVVPDTSGNTVSGALGSIPGNIQGFPGAVGNTVGGALGATGSTIGGAFGAAGNAIGNAVGGTVGAVESFAIRALWVIVGLVVAVVAILMLTGSDIKQVSIPNLQKSSSEAETAAEIGAV